MEANRVVRHRFQSFWHGEALSPYELFCLQSFVTCGYDVDLYTYNANLVVPAGVRVCDAASLVSRDRVFVYQAEGFGKGSPSAFSNFFRYKLLVEKGGWWIDTDVVCLTDRIPLVDEFYARQDADLVACGTMYFKPHHPVMVRCLEQATKLGRTVKWGDSGPRLFTRVLTDCGLIERAVPASVCYPTHYTQALDALRPSQTAALAPQLEGALFLHLWNGMLTFGGVNKACLPPKGSLLRGWVDKYPVKGWTGEYDEHTLEQVLALKSELNARAEEKIAMQSALEPQIAENERLKAAHERQVAENARSQAQLKAMQASTSWRLTAPLRALAAFGRRR
jgi:Alpha 1,4-glycosyltransferase conserved region/Glycosyltransferase sugar-binding region containing DXD motif